MYNSNKGFTIKKEIIIYLSLFVFLAFIMHQEAWLNAPIDHIKNVSNSTMGTYHPIYLSLIIYLIILGIRKLFGFISKKFKKNDLAE